MDNTDFSRPHLTEPGVTYFLHQTLKQCHIVREKFHNLIFNVGMFIAFLLVLGLILLYKYKGKLSPVELDKKNREKQQYILSKIKNYQDAKLRSQQSLITGLPQWDDEYDFTHKKIGKF